MCECGIIGLNWAIAIAAACKDCFQIGRFPLGSVKHLPENPIVFLKIHDKSSRKSAYILKIHDPHRPHPAHLHRPHSRALALRALISVSPAEVAGVSPLAPQGDPWSLSD